MITLSDVYLESIPTYWMLRMVLLAVFIICGYGISYRNEDNRYFWYYGAIITVFYALIEGLRFERGTDYHQYYTELIGALDASMDREALYQLIVDTVQWLKIPFWAVFVCYSGLIITSVLAVLKHFPRYALIALPIFFFLTDYPAENLIRQFVAIPFLMFAFSAYLNGKMIKTFILLAFIPFIHLSGLFGIGFFVALMFFNPTKYVRSAWILIGVYVVLSIVWDASYMGNFSDSLSDTTIGGGDSKYQNYLDDSERWFSDEGSIGLLNNSSSEQSTFAKLMNYLYNSLIIYFGFLGAKLDDRMRIPFWFTYLSIVILSIAGDVELYVRFGWWVNMFFPLTVAYAFRDVPMRMIYRMAFVACFAYIYIYQLMVNFGTRPVDGCAFVWDIV